MSQVSSLVKSISALPDPTKKRVSAILGAVVADAASLPLDWIYDDAKMKEIVGTSDPEFWEECKSPFFITKTGDVSCYNDEMKTSLRAVAKTSGNPDASAICRQLCEFFGSPDSPYQIALAKRAAKKYPVPGPWINGGVIKMLAGVEEGVNPPGSEDCHDNDGFAVSLPVLLKDQNKAIDVSKLVTTNEMISRHLPVQYKIVENYLNGVPDPIASAKKEFEHEFADVCEEIGKVEEKVAEGKSLGEIVSEFGKACPLPGSFQGSIGALLTHKDFVSTIRANILAGGDCCSRANFIGACLGAQGGVEVIPMEWIEKVHGIHDVIEDAIKVY